MKTPSKYLNLEFLRLVKQDNYCSVNNEYCAEELDELIIDKETRLAEQQVKEAAKNEAAWLRGQGMGLIELCAGWMRQLKAKRNGGELPTPQPKAVAPLALDLGRSDMAKFLIAGYIYNMQPEPKLLKSLGFRL